MEIWRKIQIANVILAVLAVALTLTTYFQPSIVYVAMWAWTFVLWLFMFLVPMPVIERNKRNNKVASALFLFLAIVLAIEADTLLKGYFPVTDSFSRGMLVYSAAYTVVALVFAAWLKLKERKSNK